MRTKLHQRARNILAFHIRGFRSNRRYLTSQGVAQNCLPLVPTDMQEATDNLRIFEEHEFMKVQEVKIEVQKIDEDYTAKVVVKVDGEWITSGVAFTAPAATIAVADAISGAKLKGWWK